jgi:RNA polymerase sigma-70 factor (ECF subfamily)
MKNRTSSHHGEEAKMLQTVERIAVPVNKTAKPTDLSVKRETFSELAISVEATLYSTALRWSGNQTQAEDLVQEVFLCAWRNFDRFTVGTCFKAWVFQILRFLFWNNQRSPGLHQRTTDFQEHETLLGSSLQTETRAEVASTDWESVIPNLVDDRLKHALDRLTPTQRMLALRIPLDGLTYQECADELGIPIGTVMSRYWRARTRLRQELRRTTARPVHYANAKP